MRFDIVSIFPESFHSYFSSSILARAQKKGLIDIRLYNLRDFAVDKRRTVDDKPYGGGPGMIFKVEPIFKAVCTILKIPESKFLIFKKLRKPTKTRIILFSAKGKVLTQKKVKQLSKYKQLILICGHYEGVDERVAKYIADEEISVGEYVLTGGEIPAMILVDAVSRYVPGVIGKTESLKVESFSHEGYVEYPQYTRPEIFKPQMAKNKPEAAVKGWRVPKVLLSGDHKKIEVWREQHSGIKAKKQKEADKERD